MFLLHGAIGWSVICDCGISWSYLLTFRYTVKPVLGGHSKIDKTKNLLTNGRLMKVEIIQGGAFCNTFDLH